MLTSALLQKFTGLSGGEKGFEFATRKLDFVFNPCLPEAPDGTMTCYNKPWPYLALQEDKG